MKIINLTAREKEVLNIVADSWDCIPSCYLGGFEEWLGEHFDGLLKQYGSENLEVQ